MTGHRGQRGFSLVEVMIATVILGVALVGLAGGITTALAAGRDSERQSAVVMYAAGLVETLQAEGYYVDGETQGECGPGLENYRWHQRLSPGDLDGLHDVTVTIQHEPSGRDVFELRTMLFEVPREITSTSRDSAREREGASRGGGREPGNR